MIKIVEIVIVMFGGSLGALSRYHIGLLIMKRFPEPPIPVAMLIINVVGSLALGMIVSLEIESQLVLATLATGYFAAFTTFSAFSVEAIQLWEKQYYRQFITYILLTITLSIMGFLLGFHIL